MKFASFAPWREVAPLRLSEEGYGMELTRHEELRRPAKSSDDMRLEITIPLSNDIVLVGIGKIRHGDNCPHGKPGKSNKTIAERISSLMFAGLRSGGNPPTRNARSSSISNLWDNAGRRGFDYLSSYRSYASFGAEGFYPSDPISGAFGALMVKGALSTPIWFGRIDGGDFRYSSTTLICERVSRGPRR